MPPKKKRALRQRPQSPEIQDDIVQNRQEHLEDGQDNTILQQMLDAQQQQMLIQQRQIEESIQSAMSKFNALQEKTNSGEKSFKFAPRQKGLQIQYDSHTLILSELDSVERFCSAGEKELAYSKISKIRDLIQLRREDLRIAGKHG